MSKKKEKTFEDSLKRLQEISELLDNEDVGIDETIKLYEEGVILSKKCYNTLKDAELKIVELKKELETNLSDDSPSE